MRARNLACVQWFWFMMVNDTTERGDNPSFAPPIPMTWTFWWWCVSHRCSGKLSVMNNIDKAQSSKALALLIWPLNVTTATWQVIRNVLGLPLGSGCNKWELWHVEESSTSASYACTLPRPALVLALAVMLWSNCWCSNVWCEFRHFWHLWL